MTSVVWTSVGAGRAWPASWIVIAAALLALGGAAAACVGRPTVGLPAPPPPAAGPPPAVRPPPRARRVPGTQPHAPARDRRPGWLGAPRGGESPAARPARAAGTAAPRLRDLRRGQPGLGERHRRDHDGAAHGGAAVPALRDGRERAGRLGPHRAG